jgi:chromosome segregation ATPase
VDEQILKDFETNLKMFEKSFDNVVSDLSGKLTDLSEKAIEMADNTDFLKKMKKNYDTQSKRLKTIEQTVDELMKRLNQL